LGSPLWIGTAMLGDQLEQAIDVDGLANDRVANVLE
jgi:hypothetical protein